MHTEAVAILCSPGPGKFVAIYSEKYRSVCFPGGSIDPGEGVKAAAVRELWEETGLIVTQEPVILGKARAVRRLCAAVWCVAAGTLDGSNEGSAYIVPEKSLYLGPYGPWTKWAVELAVKQGLYSRGGDPSK